MGRPPAGGGPTFRFIASEVTEMELILQEHHNSMPPREVLAALADKFNESPERNGKIPVQMKQVWNWFQNRRYAVRAKTTKPPAKSNVASMEDSTPARSVPQPMQASIGAFPTTTAIHAPSVPSAGRPTAENSVMEFEAKSARDGAWYDVAAFMAHRPLNAGNLEALVRFSGFGSDEDEWLDVRKNVRPRSLPCEASECVAVLPGDLILCFQEGKDQALYFDAHVLDAQRRRHDVRGCRCRFLVRYDHDQSEEIVALRKICRRPETDYRLQQLHTANVSASTDQQKISTDSSTASYQKGVNISAVGMMQKQQNAAVPAVTTSVAKADIPMGAQQIATTKPESTDTSNFTPAGNPNAPPSAIALMNRSTEISSATSSGNPNTISQLTTMLNIMPMTSGISAGNFIALPSAAATMNSSNPDATGENMQEGKSY